jgi:lipoate-protein ligase A
MGDAETGPRPRDAAPMTATVVIHRRIPGEPLEDLALEAELLARAGEGSASMLATSWLEPTVVLGYGQPVEDVDLTWCRAQGIPVLRRMTGGTGVVHHRDLGFALFLPDDHPWCGSVLGLYGRFLDVLAPVIERLGGPLVRGEGHAPSRDDRSAICFEDRLADTLIRDGRKVVGCAQARRRGGALIHAAVPLALHAELYAKVFRVERERVAANLGPAATRHSPSEVSEALESAFIRAVGLRAERGVPPLPRREFLERASESRWAPVPP